MKSTKSAVYDVRERAERDPMCGFRTPAEYFDGVQAEGPAHSRADVRDWRLRPLLVADDNDRAGPGGATFLLPRGMTPPALLAGPGSDEHGEYSNPYGGFLVPSSVRQGELFERGMGGDPTAGRTTVIPMEVPRESIPVRADATHTTSATGGFVFTRKPETVSATTSRGQVESVTLTASTLLGFTYTTDELATDSPRMIALHVDGGYRLQASAHLLNEKIRGLGDAEYLGVLNSDARITVTKETGQLADTIVAANVSKMAARCWGFERAIWLANHDTFSQLAMLTVGIGASPLLSYTPLEGAAMTLAGRPLYYTEYASTLGDAGDLMLVNWSQYLEGIYRPLERAESVHVRYVEHERAFRFTVRNAGTPWWNQPMTPANGAATLSPIVTLAARA